MDDKTRKELIVNLAKKKLDEYEFGLPDSKPAENDTFSAIAWDIDRVLDPLNCIKPEWHERQQQLKTNVLPDSETVVKKAGATIASGEPITISWDDAYVLPFSDLNVTSVGLAKCQDCGLAFYKGHECKPPKKKRGMEWL